MEKECKRVIDQCGYNDTCHVLLTDWSVEASCRETNFSIQKSLVMTELKSISKESVLYPGEYVPMKNQASSGEYLRGMDIEVVSQPRVNIAEYEHFYKLEVVVPGVRREDIVIELHGKLLSFFVSHNISEECDRKERLHEFDGCYFERHISLPRNCDPEFISAEYKDGIIVMQIPKSVWGEQVFNRRVVVY